MTINASQVTAVHLLGGVHDGAAAVQRYPRHDLTQAPPIHSSLLERSAAQGYAPQEAYVALIMLSQHNDRGDGRDRRTGVPLLTPASALPFSLVSRLNDIVGEAGAIYKSYSTAMAQYDAYHEHWVNYMRDICV
ncbi:hypothetical protein Ct61P_14696 [Colletotrichum tofieldiae]|nr:hypothetical protein Ct61P_14696 [Colletotrichum tofieldiae]